MSAGMPHNTGGRQGSPPQSGEAMRSPLEAGPCTGSPLQAALEAEDFEFAARCLLAGVARALEKLPAGSLEGMLDVIIGRKNGSEARRRKTAKKGL